MKSVKNTKKASFFRKEGIMKKETFSFKSSNKRTDINAIKWTVDNPKAILQLAHGMVEFIDRYDDFAKFLNKHDILVVGHDHLGHGHSVVSQDEWGFFDDHDATQYLIDDMHHITMVFKESYPNVPYFVFGHSMGSFITRYYLTQYSQVVDGAIICGTGQNPKLELIGGKTLAGIISTFKGNRYRSKLIDDLAFGSMNKAVKNPRTDKDWLSRDPKQVDLYLGEPRCNFMFTLNGYKHLFDTCLKVQDKKYINNIRKDLPILMISGDEDPVGGKEGKRVLEVYEQFKSIGINNIECILYPEYRHEILNEINNDIVYNDVLNWIEKRI